jgi:hypothetical protein
MINFSVAAKKSRDVVSHLLDAAKSAAEAADAHRRQQAALMAVVAQREREREQQQQHIQQVQQQAYLNGTPHSNGSLDRHSPAQSHSPLDQLAPTNLPHPGMSLPVGSMPLGIGAGNIAPVPLNIHTGNGWQDPVSAGGMGSTTPQGMPPGGAFWDDMMWESFPPMPEAPAHHQAFTMDGYVHNNSANWSPHTNDVSSHTWNGFPAHSM